jgi:hypothetical protein
MMLDRNQRKSICPFPLKLQQSRTFDVAREMVYVVQGGVTISKGEREKERERAAGTPPL